MDLNTAPDPESSRTRPALRRQRFSIIAFTATLSVCAVIALDLGWYVPGIRALLHQARLELPGYTQILLELSSAFIAGGWIVVALLPFVVGLVAPRMGHPVIPDQFRTWRAIRSLRASVLALGIILLVVVFTHFAVSDPFVNLVKALSSGSGR